MPDERIVYAYSMTVDGERISASLTTVELRPVDGGTELHPYPAGPAVSILARPACPPSRRGPLRSPSFLSKLKRRKVWQVTAAYLAGGLTTLLAVAELYDVFGLPDGTPRVVAAVLAGGLPVALLLGWFFDVRRDRGSGPSATAEPPAPRVAGSAPRVGIEESGRESIVVLPFDNFSPDAGDAWFSDGLTEEITTDLSYIRSLRVISRTSASALKSEARSARDIHREHDVDYVLEGSVRKAGESIRVTAQLIRTETDEHLYPTPWSPSGSGGPAATTSPSRSRSRSSSWPGPGGRTRRGPRAERGPRGRA